MITRVYQNSNGERQEVTLSAEAWEVMTEESLQAALGFGESAPEEPEAKPAPAAKKPAAKKK